MNKVLMIIISFILCIILAGTVSAESSVSINVQSGYTDQAGQLTTTANPGDTIYEMINIVSSTSGTGGLVLTDVPDSGILYNDDYMVSYDNQETWIPNDGTYDPITGWTITDMNNGDSFWLKKSYTVEIIDPADTDPVDLVSPAIQVTQFNSQILVFSSAAGSNTLTVTDSKIKNTNRSNKNSKTAHNTKTKITALPASKLNPTYYAALLRMKK